MIVQGGNSGANGVLGSVQVKDGGGTTRLEVDESKVEISAEAVTMSSGTGDISLTTSHAMNLGAENYLVTASAGIDLTTDGVVDVNGAAGVTLAATASDGNVLMEAMDGDVTLAARGADRKLHLGSTLADVELVAGNDVSISATATATVSSAEVRIFSEPVDLCWLKCVDVACQTVYSTT